MATMEAHDSADARRSASRPSGRTRRQACRAALAMLFVTLAACGGGELTGPQDVTAPEEPSGEVSGGEATGPQDATAPEEPSSEVSGVVQIWDWQYDSPGLGEAFKEINRNFAAEHPDVDVQHTQQAFGQYMEIIQTAFTAGEVADVVMLQPAGRGTFLFQDAALRLNDYVTPQMREELSGWEGCSVNYDPDDAIIGIPNALQAIVFYYNKSLFEEAGLDPEQPPTTYEELVAAAEALREAGITPFGGGDQEAVQSWFWFDLFFPAVATEQDAFDLAAGDMAFTDPKVRRAAEMYVDLVELGFFEPGVASTPYFPTAIDDFAAGKQAMFAGFASVDASYLQFNETLGADNVGLFQGLGVDGGETNFLPAGTGVCWVIPANSDNPDAAFEWITFMTGAESARIQFDQGGFLPNNSAVEFGDDTPPQPRQMVEEFADNPTSTSPLSLWKLPVANEYGKQLQLVITGQSSLEEALQAVQAVQEQQR